MLYSEGSLTWHWMGVLNARYKNEESAPGKAYRQMRELLLNGGWPPGFVLPGENVLKDMLDVGRPALREAMIHIELYGALIKVHGHKTVIAPDFKPEMLRTNPFATGPLSPKEFQDMQVFRQIVEVKCAELAATNVTATNLEALERALNAMTENVNDLQQFSAADCEFHFTLIKASGNIAFIAAGHALRGMYESYLNEINQSCTSLPECVTAHAQVYTAIKNGDPDAAGRAMTSLIAMSLQQTHKQPGDSE
ncbi:MAG: FadR/GntR family transcriptional regulator [Scandinavium sp.]|uniref:FadR/GntR family transcriptional regulator n=1 Tax=Scandinavium sp. TaxID=2830653 RepID=UPI003F39F48F